MPGTPFLTRTDFDGIDGRPALPCSTGAGLSTYGGQIAFTNLPCATVADLLPNRLSLAQNIGAHPDVHPVIHLQGKQTNTRWVINNTPYTGVGSDYDEFILLIPFVQANAGSQWHNFAVRMYLTDGNAKWIGNTYYGYEKELASVSNFPPDFEVFANRKTAFLSNVRSDGAFRSDAQAKVDLPNYEEIQAICKMPVLGVNKFTRKLIYSYFEWDYSAAQVAPISSEHHYESGFDPYGMPGTSLKSVPDGAIDIRGLAWRLSLPPGFY